MIISHSSKRLHIIAVLCLCLNSKIKGETAGSHPINLGEISFAIPSDWEIVTQPNSLFIARAPKDSDEDSFRENFHLSTHPIGVSRPLNSIVSAQIKAAHDENYEVIGSGDLSGTNVPVKWIAATKKGTADAGLILNIDYLLNHDDDLYVFHCILHAESDKRYRPMFEQIVRSVRLPSRSATSGDERQLARETGERVGNVTFYVLVSVVLGYIAFRILRGLSKRGHTSTP